MSFLPGDVVQQKKNLQAKADCDHLVQYRCNVRYEAAPSTCSGAPTAAHDHLLISDSDCSDLHHKQGDPEWLVLCQGALGRVDDVMVLALREILRLH